MFLLQNWFLENTDKIIYIYYVGRISCFFLFVKKVFSWCVPVCWYFDMFDKYIDWLNGFLSRIFTNVLNVIHAFYLSFCSSWWYIITCIYFYFVIKDNHKASANESIRISCNTSTKTVSGDNQVGNLTLETCTIFIWYLCHT